MRAILNTWCGSTQNVEIEAKSPPPRYEIPFVATGGHGIRAFEFIGWQEGLAIYREKETSLPAGCMVSYRQALS